tara:strand:- start:521 stop:745 length:225 start_codon:yes stop_codon:yes gene_type:complete
LKKQLLGAFWGKSRFFKKIDFLAKNLIFYFFKNIFCNRLKKTFFSEFVKHGLIAAFQRRFRWQKILQLEWSKFI